MLPSVKGNSNYDRSRLSVATTFGTKVDMKPGWDDLKRLIKDVDPSVLILDPIYKFISTTTPDNIQHFADKMDELIQEFRLSILLIHHTRKPMADNSGQIIRQGVLDMRDARIWEMWAETIIGMYGDPSKDERTLYFESRNARTIIAPLNITLDRTKLWFEVS